MCGSDQKWMAVFAVVAAGLWASPGFAATSGISDVLAVGAGAQLPNWVFQTFDYIVLAMLALASVAGISLAIDAMLHIRESKIAPPQTTEHLRSLISSREYKELMDFTATDSSFVSKALYAAIRRAHLKYPAMREALDTSIGEQTSDLFRRIEPMNVIGNIGPLLGLLGTVLGMIMAFYTLKDAGGDAKPEQLSGGIATALWHTFFGLFVAIPCLVVYGFYRTRADKIAAKAGLIAEELLEGLRPESPEEAAAATAKKKRPGTRDITEAPIPQPIAEI